eukprot:c32568_g1_i1.p1 GENE.c32568_g1_i1~~c32568_g1_i1.p1  ORF type:complete len:179 (+),score=36.76 c32568_g1_i1:45-581(+)
MPVQYSPFDETGVRICCRTALLPLKTRTSGPAPSADPDKEDIVDFAIDSFKCNCLHKNFEFKSCGDRTLVYATLFISQCISRIHAKKPPTVIEARKQLLTLATTEFAKPGESAFPVSAFFEAPQTREEAEDWRLYIKQLREEIVLRLVEHLYNQDGSINKFWVHQFVKRKFMNKSLGE